MSGRRGNVRLGAPPLWRGYAVLAAFALVAVALCARAFDLQVVDHKFLAHEGDKRFVRTLAVPAGRGAIRDRNGEPLALSAPTESVWAVPGALLDARAKLAPLAQHLGMSTAELRKRLERYKDRKFLYLRRQLSPAHARRVMDVDAPGVFLQREYRRFYPAGEAAAQLVGLVNIAGRGQLGMELARNGYLHGTPGSRRVVKDGRGKVVEDLSGFKPPQPGHDLTLTIDTRLQYLAYRKIKAAVLKNKAHGGLVVMLDPHTGDVLAMASYPSFNPNDRGTITPDGMRARAAIDLMEPGSTIKPLLLSTALKSGEFTTTSRINTHGGRFQVGRLTITDYHDYGHETFATILQKSSNVGAAHVGLALGPKAVWKGYHAFGLGQTTGSGFPGERSGILKDYYKWGDVETATASYGYGVAVTALQLARAYGTIADGGLLRQLRFIRGKGAYEQLPPKRVISAQTAANIRQMLEGVVTPEGTARRAALDDYQVAGKTGTARKAGGGSYNDEEHQALFVGMAPAANPRLVTLVMVDEPSAGQYYGGLVAAPVFADITRAAMRYLGVPPQTVTHTADASPHRGDKS